MNAWELSERNVGENLDQLMNLDPRGYGVCRILYAGSRDYMKEPIAMKCAKGLKNALSGGDIVYIITGFVLMPHKHGEMDGIIGAMLLARMLVRAYGAHPVIVCPEECSEAVQALSNTVGLHMYDDPKEFMEYPTAVCRVVFTKDASSAEAQADELIILLPPKAVIAIEAPGANDRGVYHNAKGRDLSFLQAKTDAILEKCISSGVYTMAIGDLGNELGMGSIREHLQKYVPFMEEGGCVCGCGGSSLAHVGAQDIITTTISHWGAEAVIAATAYLHRNPDLIHSKDIEIDAIRTASRCGMVDMYGWLDLCIDGIDMDFHVNLLEMMRACVVNAFKHIDLCADWFIKVGEKQFFTENA